MKYFIVIIFLTCVQVLAASKPSIELLVSSLNLKEVSTDFVLVNMWSPSCGPCSEEVAELNKVFSQDSTLVTVIGVAVDGRKTEANEFVEHFKPLYEQRSVDSETRQQLMLIGAVPYTILLDKKRNLVHGWAGKITASDLMLAIAKQTKE